jgi:tetratricopeptide (TPR) repeat protein
MSCPSDHIDDNAHTRAIEHEFETVPATAAAKEDWDRILGMLHQDAAKSQAEAAFIMQDYNATKRPFVLFLRSFEMEAYDYLTPEAASGERRVISALAGPSPVEQKLAAALTGRLRGLGVANPSQLLTYRGSFPRLQLPNEGWQAVVQNLVEHAAFIVMDCTSLAPGVLWELETIRAANKQNTAIIIIPSPDEPDPGTASLPRAAEIFGAVVVKRNRPLKDSPALSAFPRVATGDEIAFDKLDTSLLFADLLASAEARATAAPAFDAVAYATRLSNEGVSLFNENRYAEAMDKYQQALLLRRHLNNRAGLLTSLLNIGILYVDAKQPAGAMAPFTEALDIARELNRPIDEGLLASYLGVAHKELGQLDEAKKWLVQAYQLQSVSSPPSDVENTLTKLSDVFQAVGDGDGMVETFKELRAYFRRRGDQAGELRVTLQLGATYYSAGLLAPAGQLFQEGVRLSHEVGDHEREGLCATMLQRIAANLAQASGGTATGSSAKG